MKKIKYIAIAALGLVACEPEFDNDITDSGFYSTGTANLDNFVAIGNSLTAGFADGALYVQGQENSFPNIMASKFAQAGSTQEFSQPLTSDNLGGLLLGGVQISPNRLVLSASAPGAGDLAPVILDGTPTTEVSIPLTGTFHNMGVPGAKSFHLLSPGYGDVGGVPLGLANPYYARFASSSTATVMGDALAQNPSFFSLWIGNNDVLSFATSGGVGEDQTGNLDPATYGPNDITDPTVFAGTLDAIMSSLNGAGAQGIVCNLPDVTSIPYFTTIPFNSIPMDATTAAGTNAAYAAYNGGLLAAQGGGFITADEVAARTINFVEGNNAVVIEDESLTNLAGLGLPNIRQATADDFIVLPTLSILGTLADPADPTSVIGVGVALNDGQVLTANEASMVFAAQAQYNATLAALASAYGFDLIDMRALLEDLNVNGVAYNGGTMTSAFATGNGFSLDGVHPTARGYAYIADQMIEMINNNYGANIPRIDIGEYPGTMIN
ncbi:MAG: SGNH/GDSL hydrolase family protein [Flavobacteriaceae bacterium]|nr:SGNH/GDSL hydrolase family protein [Flavobacteriaceae bacterium]